MFCDMDKLSNARKIAISILIVLYALSVLGTAHTGNMTKVIGVTLFFIALKYLVLLWIK